MEDNKMVLPKFFQIEVDVKDNQVMSIKDINEEPITDELSKEIFNVLVKNGYINIFEQVSHIRILGHGDGIEEYVDVWTMDEDGDLLVCDEVNLSPSIQMDEFLNLF